MNPRILVLVSAVALLLGGCASPTMPMNMAVAPSALSKSHSGAVAVNTSGGEETNPAMMSKVSDADLRAAIEESIRRTKLFSAVVKVGEADYVLNASIVSLSQPMMGFDMTVQAEILWSLTPKGAAKPVWEKSVKSQATKGVGDAFAGVKRLRLVTEAAIQENIAKTLPEIAALDLK